MNAEKGWHVIVAGCGAIGSFLVALLARMPGIAHLTLVDGDTYQLSNLCSQNIYRCDVNELKVAVQARRVRALNPQLEVTAIPAVIADVPLGMLRAGLIVACVDSLGARLTINELAWHVGANWIDAGVLESENLARVNVYMPAVGSPCLECALSDEDYKLLDAEYPCGGGGGAERPSDTSAALASLVASMAAIECQKMLHGDERHAAIGRQVTVDACTHRMLSTSFRRNPGCRFDHASWDIVPLRCSLQRLTLAEALAITGPVRVAGHRFVRALVCSKCGFRMEGLRLDRPKARCIKCGARMIAPGFDALLDRLDASLPQECLGRNLAQLGFRPGDVICGTEKQVELLAEAI